MKTNPGQLLKAVQREIKQLNTQKRYNEALSRLRNEDLEKKYPHLDHSETKMLYSDALVGLERYAEALDKLSSVEKRLRTIYFYKRRAYCNKQLNYFVDAIIDYQECYNLDENLDDKTLQNWARCHEELKDYDTAIEILNRVQTKNKQVLMSIGQLYAFKNDYTKQLEILLTISEREKDPTVYVTIGICYERLKNYPQAIAAFKAAGRQGKLELARCYQNMGEFTNSISTLQDIPKTAESLLAQAYCYHDMGKNMAALKIYNDNERLIQQDSNYLLKFALLYRQNHPQIACRIFSELSKRSDITDYIKIITEWSGCYESLKRYDDAIRVLSKLSREEQKREAIQIIYSRLYFKSGDYQKAASILEELSKKQPENRQFLIHLGNCYQKLRNTQTAIDTYISIPSWHTDPSILINVGLCYRDQGYHDKAEATWKIARKTPTPELITLAIIYQEQQEHSKAIEVYLSILKQNEDEQTLISLAACYEEMSNFVAAIDVYKLMPNLEKNTQAMERLARCFWKTEQYEKAIETYIKTPDYKTNSPLLISLARCYENINQYNTALETYDSIPDLQQNVNASISLARCYQKMGLYKKAVQTFLNIPNSKQTVTVTIGLARCYQDMGQYQKGLDILLGIPDLNTDPEALLTLARHYECMGLFDDAIKTFHAIPNLKANLSARLSLGRCYQNMKEYTKALTVFLDIPKIEQNDIALLTLVRCYQEMGENEMVFQIVNEMPGLEHNDMVRLSLARAHLEKCQYEEVLKILDSIANKKNRNTTISINLAKCYQAMGKFDQALHIFLEIPNYKTNPNAVLGLARLYECMGQYQESLQAFLEIPGLKNNAVVSMQLAVLYRKMDRDVDAKKILRDLPREYLNKLELGSAYKKRSNINKNEKNQANISYTLDEDDFEKIVNQIDQIVISDHFSYFSQHDMFFNILLQSNQSIGSNDALQQHIPTCLHCKNMRPDLIYSYISIYERQQAYYHEVKMERKSNELLQKRGLFQPQKDVKENNTVLEVIKNAEEDNSSDVEDSNDRQNKKGKFH